MTATTDHPAAPSGVDLADLDLFEDGPPWAASLCGM